MTTPEEHETALMVVDGLLNAHARIADREAKNRQMMDALRAIARCPVLPGHIGADDLEDQLIWMRDKARAAIYVAEGQA